MLALGFDDAVDDSDVCVFGVTLREGLDGLEDLVDGLVNSGCSAFFSFTISMTRSVYFTFPP